MTKVSPVLFLLDPTFTNTPSSVFNYYEPLNFIIRGFGKQTWEYSPVYAIRSWAYLLPYAIATYPISFIVDSLKLYPSITFYTIRLLLVSFTVYSEWHLYHCLVKYWGEKSLARWYLFFSAISTGYSHASVALLPSSLGMNCATLATSNFIKFWKKGTVRHALLITSWFAIGGLFGWPFVLALAVPSMIYILGYYYLNHVSAKLNRYVSWSISIVAFYTSVIMQVDYHFYSKTMVVPLNIVLYNVINASEESGPNIFGTEPVTYYLVNLALNFNIIAIAAVFGFAVGPLSIWLNGKFGKYGIIKIVFLMAPLALWVGVFFSQPHKEERFLYPIYPLITLSGAIAVHYTISLFCTIIPLKRFKIFLNYTLVIVVALLVGTISILKTVSLSKNYGAPLEVYSKIPIDAKGNLCLGREWYRYPSSFFLPDGLRLKFIKSGFNGLLPGDFDESFGDVLKAIATEPANMNNLNRFDPSKLTEFEHCDYAIDIDEQVDTEIGEISFVDKGQVKNGWELVASAPFLNNELSKGLGRLIYIPEFLNQLTKTELVYHHYNLYKKAQ